MIRQDFLQDGSRTYLETRDLVANIRGFLSVAPDIVEPNTIALINNFITSLVETVEECETDSSTVIVSDTTLDKFVSNEMKRMIRQVELLKKVKNPKLKPLIIGLSNDTISLSDNEEDTPEEEVLEEETSIQEDVSAPSRKKKNKKSVEETEEE